MARVLKGKYCHDTSFLDCKLPSNPSHGWRGIMAGRKILERGLGWLVGSGEGIRVWQDPWLDPSSPLRPVGPAREANCNLNVKDLIHHDSKTWNIAAIRQELPAYENMILKLPLGKSDLSDTLAWLPSKAGIYSVKTGYALVTGSIGVEEPSVVNWEKDVWKVKTQPKIRTFLWKALRGALPVGHQLERRGIGDHILCKRCGQTETIDHVLLNCVYAQKVWDQAPLWLPRFDQLPTIQLFLAGARKGKTLPPSGIVKADLYAWLLWNLWTSRNQLLFSDKDFSISEVITKATLDAQQWQLAQESLPSPKRNSLQPPPDTEHLSGLLCFVDANGTLLLWRVV